jgi:ATP-binding cassette subfamily B protein
MAAAAVAWEQLAPLFRAAGRAHSTASPIYALAGGGGDGPEDGGDAAIDARDLLYRYREGGDPVLRGVTLEIRRGDHVLIEGPSGGGKSTLASLLAGLRQPTSGLLLLGGLDRPSLGLESWRRRVASAPQFHENHVLTTTLSFNLLFGRDWPATNEDLVEAEEVCRELALGPLLDRMPSGILQMIGETGWQLSHGERSRIYIARALLQKSEIVILDESFAALDPETLRQSFDCVMRRANTLILIAHP